MSEKFLKERVELHCGDCLEILPTLADNSIDSCVTDPPYHLTSIVKRFGSPTAKPVRIGDINATNDLKAAHARAAAGFMGKQWDGGDIAQNVELWRHVYRVLKPGAHLLAFGGTRTYHRMACAIEDAGFEIRDTIMWLYGSGFPKSHDVSKGIEAKLTLGRADSVGLRMRDGNEAGTVGTRMHTHALAGAVKGNNAAVSHPTARQWQGWGTALKPACEPIVLARKPLSEGTVAANVLKHGTGALNIDGCRVEGDDGSNRSRNNSVCEQDGFFLGKKRINQVIPHGLGRWPANLIHDGSEEVVEGFPDADGAVSNGRRGKQGIYKDGIGAAPQLPSYDDTGSAARFFYTSKADSDDRLGSKHPTVKPLDLMQYLVRLITPKGGIVLDPFAGTGTTGEAAWREGMKAVLIEREAEYQADIRRRMELVLSGPDERTREGIKQRTKDNPRDEGPLFSWS